MIDFAIVVKEEQGRARKGSPITVGLPFSQGAVTDLSHLCVLDGADPVPAQLSAACRWQDGSLRWVHARMSLDLQAGEERNLTIATDGGCPPAGPPLIRDVESGWQPVDQELAAQLKPGGSFAARLQITKKSGAVHRWLDPVKVEIEEAGPNYASVLEARALDD